MYFHGRYILNNNAYQPHLNNSHLHQNDIQHCCSHHHKTHFQTIMGFHKLKIIYTVKLLIKGKFDAYVLWPLTKRFKNWIVDRFTACVFMVCKLLLPNLQFFIRVNWGFLESPTLPHNFWLELVYTKQYTDRNKFEDSY